MGNDNMVYNSQLVSYLLALHRLHHAEFGPEDAFSLYHIIQEEAGNGSAASGVGPALPALGHALAGSLATAGAKVLLYPIDLVVTRLQVQRQLRGKGEAESAARDADKEYSNVLDAAQKIFKSEGGLKAFYTGCAPAVGKGIADSFLFFLAYTFLRQYEQRRIGGDRHLPVSKELGVGIAAGVFAKLFTTPVQNIVTRQQTAALVAARDPTSTTTPGESDQLSIKDIALQIRSERGLAGFWAGYSESVILTLNPAITFAVDILLKRLLRRSSRRENDNKEPISPHLTFLIAALSKAIATTLTYPAMLAKSRAQTATPSSEEEDDATPPDLEKPASANSTATRRRLQTLIRYTSVYANYNLFLLLRSIYRTEGLSGLYSGLEGEVLKGFMSHGLTMMMKEKAHVGVIRAYYFLLKLTRRWPKEVQKGKAGVREVAADARERVGNVGERVSEGVKGVVGGKSE